MEGPVPDLEEGEETGGKGDVAWGLMGSITGVGKGFCCGIGLAAKLGGLKMTTNYQKRKEKLIKKKETTLVSYFDDLYNF